MTNGLVNRCAHDCYSHKCIAKRHAPHSHSQTLAFPRPHPFHTLIPFLYHNHHLLKHLPIRVGVFLAINHNRLLPRPLIIHKLLILRLAGIQFLEFVALVIRRYVEGWLGFLAADDEGALDNGVVFLAIDGRGTEDVFAGGFESGEESAWQVCG